MCASSRESIMYQSSHFHSGTPLALSLIADTALNAAFLPDEIDAQRDAASYEVREINAKPEMIIPEVLHAVAYGGQTLGNPLLCPEPQIESMNEGVLRRCMKEWYRPERMVVAGAGMPHEELVELTDRYFSSLKPSSSFLPSTSRTTQSLPSHLLPTPTPSSLKSSTRSASSFLNPFASSGSPTDPVNMPATYVGGEREIIDTSSEFNHLYLAFEGVGIHDPDIYAVATMQVLLGGGGSFSAGMFCLGKRLTSLINVSNRWSWEGHVFTTVYRHPQFIRSN